MSVAAVAECGNGCVQTDLDQSAAEFSAILTKAEIKRFSELNALRFFAALGLDMFILIVSIFMSERSHSLAVYLAAVILIGSRLHAFAVLMHEATHYRAASTRWLNEMTGEILALTVLIKLKDYRKNHFAHHRHLNTADDPDWARKLGDKDFAYPKSNLEIVTMLLPFAIGIKFVVLFYKFTRQSKKQGPSRSRLSLLTVARTIAIMLIAATSIFTGIWSLLIFYWIIPLLTSFMVFFQIRSVAEHFAIEYNHPFNQTRTVISPFWEAWLLAPHGVNYHLEHHLYPSVPFYRLPEVHNRLMAIEEYRKKAHITSGYLTDLLQECKAAKSTSKQLVTTG